MKLETERLVLREWIPEDFEAVVALYADPQVMKHLSLDGKPLTRFQSWQTFCAILGHWRLRGFGMFAAVERGTNEFVGRIGPWYPEGWPGFEVGWTLRPKFWGRGYATEAARRCIDFSFTDLGQDQVISLIEETNMRSIKVAERVGEKPDGMVVLEHAPTARTLKFTLNRSEWVKGWPSQ